MSRIIIDPAQVSLLLSSGHIGDADEIDLIIEQSFTIRKADGITYTVNPAVAETLTSVLSLRLLAAISLVAGCDGSLTVRFAEGTEIRVTKHDRYEAWHTFGRGNFAEANMLCSAHEGSPWGE